MQAAKGMAQDAATAKACGCLLHFYKTQQTLETLREQVQAELRDFGSYGLKERDVLAKGVLVRVEMALAMRKPRS